MKLAYVVLVVVLSAVTLMYCYRDDLKKVRYRCQCEQNTEFMELHPIDGR